jgi:hypothetical protein
MVSSLNKFDFDFILVYGDSHLAGMDLYGYTNDNITKKLTWPALVGKHFNVPVKNFSLSGGSNDRSMRILTETLLQFPNSLVIYGLTSWDRGEIFDKKILYTHVGYCNIDYYKGKPEQKINDFYIDKILENRIFEMKNNNYRILNHVIYVQTFLKTYAKDYILFKAFPYVFDFQEVKHQKIILKNIDKSKFLNFKSGTQQFSNWVEWCEYNNFPLGKNNHYTEQAHEEFAKIFINEYSTFNM